MAHVNVSYLYMATPSEAWAFLDKFKVLLDEGVFPRTTNPFQILTATHGLLADHVPHHPHLSERVPV